MYVKLFILFYADNTVIISESADGLQHALNEFYTYCNQWKPKLWSFQKAQHKKMYFISMNKLSNL